MKTKTAIAISVASVLLSFVTQAQEPKHATARIRIYHRNAAPDQAEAAAADLARIVSEPVLIEVSSRLNLAEKWNLPEDKAVGALKETLSVTPFLNTSLISIRAAGADDAEAVAIANGVANAFKEMIDEENRAAMEAAQKEADETLKKQQALIEQLKQTLKTFDEEHGATKLQASTNESSRELLLSKYIDDEKRARDDLLVHEAKLKKLIEAKAKSMDDVLALYPDKFLESMLKEMKRLETELTEKVPTLGKENPSVKATQAALDKVSEKAKQACIEILKGVQAQCMVSKVQLESITDVIETMEQPAVATPAQKKIIAEYESMKADLEAQTKIMNQQVIMMQLHRPDCSVEIADLAELPKPPSEFVKASRAAAIQAAKNGIHPKFHHATSQISVENDEDPLFAENPYFIRTQIMIISSKLVLSNVVQNLDLAEKWKIGNVKPSAGEACAILRQKLTVLQIGTTYVVGITASSEDPDEAVSLANEVAFAYQSYVEDQIRKEQQRDKEAIGNELKKQEYIVKQAELKYQKLQEPNGLPEPPVERSNEETREVEQDRMQAKVAMLVLKSRLDLLEANKNLPLLEVADFTDSPIIRKLCSDIQSASKKLKKADTDSPEFKKQEDALFSLNQQLKPAIDDYLRQLNTEYTAQKKIYDELCKQLPTSVNPNFRKLPQKEMMEVNRAKRELELQKSLLDVLKTRAEEELLEERPQLQTVQIISLAVNAETPDH